MALEKYQEKRDFKKTPEPEALAKKGTRNRFVIQEHHASHLHFDFRLEMTENKDSGQIVLKSWAVPKGLPEKINEKRLAVEVEDHPVDYINFEGVIPEGSYGAGTVKIWDSGKYDLIKRDDKLVEFILRGEKLKGRYTLIKTRGYGGRNSWLIIKNAPKGV
ncbi:3'-phosphoesterase [candidate division WS5 bacterium]|uniref:3'-phosphoesterase n=1 Tax=candidate division WS5 bacterium TaxID=2093353 RepID=A0A419DGQ5_9BACT|nr:MAG: 3'-phosphoesterase [candidate division WS5 bacterium]